MSEDVTLSLALFVVVVLYEMCANMNKIICSS